MSDVRLVPMTAEQVERLRTTARTGAVIASELRALADAYEQGLTEEECRALGAETGAFRRGLFTTEQAYNRANDKLHATLKGSL